MSHLVMWQAEGRRPPWCAGHLNDAFCSVNVLFVWLCGEFLKKNQWSDKALGELARISVHVRPFPSSGFARTGETLNHCPHNMGRSLTDIRDVERPEREWRDHISTSLYLELLD